MIFYIFCKFVKNQIYTSQGRLVKDASAVDQDVDTTQRRSRPFDNFWHIFWISHIPLNVVQSARKLHRLQICTQLLFYQSKFIIRNAIFVPWLYAGAAKRRQHAVHFWPNSLKSQPQSQNWPQWRSPLAPTTAPSQSASWNKSKLENQSLLGRSRGE